MKNPLADHFQPAKQTRSIIRLSRPLSSIWSCFPEEDVFVPRQQGREKSNRRLHPLREEAT
jgi:hypothetical protein